MGRSKENFYDGWTKEEREFCVKQYHKRHSRVPVDLDIIKREYWEKFHVLNGRYGNWDKCPTSDHIMEWVKAHGKCKQSEKQPETNKLSGTQWGRKTGENRSIRTESVDTGEHTHNGSTRLSAETRTLSYSTGEQHQEIKWKQGDTKWNGPRPFHEKTKLKMPVVEGRPYWWYAQYNPPTPVEKDLKADKKLMLKEKFEAEVLELVESLDAHGHAARENALVSLQAALQRHVVDGVLAKHRATLADHVSRALRRGKDGERKAAAAIAPLLALQIGKEGMKQFVREVRPGLIATATDASAALDTRTECCSSLAVLCYLMDEEITETLEALRMYETIFSGSYLRDDGSVKVSGEAVEEGVLHAAALDGWTLLFPKLSPNRARSLLNKQSPSFARLGELLKAVSLEVRMAAGCALAIVYETVTDEHNALTSQVDALPPQLKELALDSDKSRAKRDRRIQRATFREILKYFEEGEVPCTSVHIGTETATWSSWSGGVAYTALATALGGALQVLAPHCPSLRAALHLSTEVPVEEKTEKLQRHRQNKATSKARTFTRNKNKGKRSLARAF